MAGVLPAPVSLASQSFGTSGPQVVVLHGLLGNSGNWRGVATILGKSCRVHCLDLRNHGSSPHTGRFDIADISADAGEWIVRNCAGEPVLLVGHSLGGKAAMKLAAHRPDLVRGLIVVDITNRSTTRRWDGVYEAMLSLDLSAMRRRGDAEDHFEKMGIQGRSFRKFISTNLQVDAAGRWSWRIGLEALAQSRHELVAEVLTDGERYEGPALLIRGGQSNFAPLEEIPALAEHLPGLRVPTIEHSGHNPHIDAPHEMIHLILNEAGIASED